jgi:hypothetical protein
MGELRDRLNIRRRGLRTAAIGFAIALLALLLIHAQLAAGAAEIAIPFALLLGWIFCAVGLFQAISGRDDAKGGIGLTGLLFVVAVGGGLMVASMFVVWPHERRDPAPQAERAPLIVSPVLEGLANAVAVPLDAGSDARR